MPRYIVTLTSDEIQELKASIQKGGKGYRIKHAQLLLKLDQKPENASLYKAFAPEEACRLAERFEWHYTPKHGSWLDMAEIEISIMSRQALWKPLPDMESFKKQVLDWTVRRNAEHTKINWKFKAKNARIKLAKLYPDIV